MARFVNGTENLENVPLPNARAKTAAKEKAQIFGFGRNEKGGTCWINSTSSLVKSHGRTRVRVGKEGATECDCTFTVVAKVAAERQEERMWPIMTDRL